MFAEAIAITLFKYGYIITFFAEHVPVFASTRIFNMLAFFETVSHFITYVSHLNFSPSYNVSKYISCFCFTVQTCRLDTSKSISHSKKLKTLLVINFKQKQDNEVFSDEYDLPSRYKLKCVFLYATANPKKLSYYKPAKNAFKNRTSGSQLV